MKLTRPIATRSGTALGLTAIVVAFVTVVLLRPLDGIQTALALRNGLTAAESQEVQAAIDWFEQIVQQQPLNITARRLLAEQAVAQQELAAAIEHLERAYRVRPRDALLREELAGLYGLANRPEQAAQLMPLSFERAVERADLYLETDNIFHASLLYMRALHELEQPNNSLLFRYAATSVASGSTVNSALWQEEFPPLPVHSARQIEGESLHWVRADPNWDLDFGDMLGEHDSANQPFGALWWDGAAVVFVEVAESGNYRVAARVRNGIRQETAKRPALLQLEHNFAAINEVEIPGFDNEWYELSQNIFLTSGLHLVGVRCMEIRPDPAVEWISIQKL